MDDLGGWLVSFYSCPQILSSFLFSSFFSSSSYLHSSFLPFSLSNLCFCLSSCPGLYGLRSFPLTRHTTILVMPYSHPACMDCTLWNPKPKEISTALVCIWGIVSYAQENASNKMTCETQVRRFMWSKCKDLRARIHHRDHVIFLQLGSNVSSCVHLLARNSHICRRARAENHRRLLGGGCN